VNYTFVSDLALIGFTAFDEGTRDLLRFLTLSNAAAGSSAELYTNRLRQELLDDVADSLDCLSAASEQYSLPTKLRESVFGFEASLYEPPTVPQPDESGKIPPDKFSEYNQAIIAFYTAKKSDKPGLLDQLERDIVAAQLVLIDAKQTLSSLRLRKNLSEDDQLKVLQASIDDLLTDIDSAQAAYDNLSDLKIETNSAAHKLRTSARAIMNGVLRENVRKAEPSLENAKTAAKDILTQFSLLGKQYEVGTSSTTDPAAPAPQVGGVEHTRADGANPTAAATADLDILNSKLKSISRSKQNLARTYRKSSNALRAVQKHIEENAPSGECSVPAPQNTLIVTPAVQSIDIVAGGKSSLNVIVAPGAEPMASVSSGDKSLLEVGTPQSRSTGGHFSIELTAAKEIKSNARLEVEIRSTGSTTAKATKVVAVSATPPPEITFPAGDTLQATRGGAAVSLAVVVNDGSTPSITETTGNAAGIVLEEAKPDPSDNKKFTFSIKVEKGATGGKTDLEVSAGFNPAKKSVKLEVNDPPAAPPPPVEPTKLNLGANERIQSLVAFVQNYANETNGAGLEANGVYDQSTKDALVKLFQNSSAELKAADGRINNTVLNFFIQKIVDANNDEIEAAWIANKEDAQKGLRHLIAGGAYPNITDDDTLDNDEKIQIVRFQLSVLAKPADFPGNSIKLNGALDAATLAVLLSNG